MISFSAIIKDFNSHAVGMVVAPPYGFEIAFGVTLFLESLHDFSLVFVNSFLNRFSKSKFIKDVLQPM